MAFVFPEEHILRLELSEKHTMDLVCTNENLRELVAGYLLNQGLIRSAEDLETLRVEPDGTAACVTLRRCEPVARVRSLGADVIRAAKSEAPRWMPLVRVYSVSEIRDSAEAMNRRAEKYKETGGVHCSALFSEGRLVSVFEDLGRHNTIDKIAGDLLLRNITVSDALLVTTGRVSSDMVQKANRLGVSVVVSYSTPTALARELAEKANMTLLAYFGREKQAVCTAERRVVC